MTSIIIPAHNEKDNLKTLLSTLCKSKQGRAVEIIVALSPENNDNTEKIACDIGIHFLKCSKRGRAAQMNEASFLAKGKILVFLHADVVPPQNFLDDISKTLSNGYDAGFFSYKFDKESFWLKINASFTGKDGIFTGGGDQCLFIKKSVFEELNGFDENQVLMEDFEFFERMKSNRVPYKIVKNDLIVSARKYEHNSYLRVNLSNLLLVILFKFGYPGNKLKHLHDKLLRTAYNG
ncbi:TIGR04283 family arsenosugar biosynthesis glycosyltransferase [Maribacter sp. 2210JD10-5]|uniref:TIGR04283 family arsenosugar biosynthesis glycosyltransferase n=1 Tax=Maribacter sp. 2210JD10-5 TaxID=3386272 RepID=UPI0039BD671B